MNTLYTTNGLIFWTEEEIKTRSLLVESFVLNLRNALKTANRAFEFVQVEAPILTPRSFINAQYSSEDMYPTQDDLVLRPETTMGSYQAAIALLNTYNDRKYKLPLVVWQHGKSFRREQDQPSKFMRLKEFYQLEFQIMFSPETKAKYEDVVIPTVRMMISEMIGDCRVEPSDRIPAYAEWTQDIICQATNMEVCSMSKRKDFAISSVLEVAIGTDRCVYNQMQRRVMT